MGCFVRTLSVRHLQFQSDGGEVRHEVIQKHPEGRQTYCTAEVDDDDKDAHDNGERNLGVIGNLVDGMHRL